jgi:16S rRNA (guanine527-N7)-methyltransferase
VNLKQYAADLFSVTLMDEQVSQFDRYTEELLAWNTHTNLTAITEPEAVMVRHHLDSLSLLKFVPLDKGMRVADVGTGAGFPGLPLHIAVEGLYTTLIEATGKKANFCNHVIKSLDLKRVMVLNARAEDAGHISHQRGKYDLVVARAVARLPILLEYLLPLAKIGGICVAMKGTTAQQEAEDSAKALSALGGELVKIEAIELPNVPEPHFLVVVKKTRQTPGIYPRKPGIPSKMPLGSS